MKKATLCVIFGGKSEEYEVSLRSARAVIEAVDTEKYEIITLGITKGGEWYIYEGDTEKIASGEWVGGRITPVTVDISSGCLLAVGKEIYAIHVDLFFPVLHGGYGENGELQGLFDMMGARYVGCGAWASHLCMDKVLTKSVAISHSIPVARLIDLDEIGENDYPVFIKPICGGSSVGASVANGKEELERGIEEALSLGKGVMVEERIRGEEIEVGVMEIGGRVVASPVGMIRYTGEYYGYSQKYERENQYLIPAPIDEKTGERVRDWAKKMFVACGCKSLARVDFFLTPSGDVVFNEVNTMPGFTAESMFPKVLRHMGYGMRETVTELLNGARKN